FFMKTKSHQIKSIALAIRLLFSLLLVFGWCLRASAQDYFLLVPSGAYEVPRNDSPSRGAGNFVLSGTILCFEIFVPNLQPTSGGIYGPAPAGVNGPLIVAITNDLLNAPDPTIATYFGTLLLTDPQVAEIEAGLWYV